MSVPPLGEQPPLYVTRPDLPPLAELIPLLEGIWDRRILTNGGPLHQELERELARHLGVPHVALFCNATVALMTALQALELRGEVITTPYSFTATAHSLLWNGLTPVFADIDRASMNLDPARLAEAVTPRTAAILPVHCYGHPCDVDAIAAVASRHGLRVVYDAAHAFMVRVQGRSLAEFGDLSVLSFHATKVFNTFEGGAIIGHDPSLMRRVEQLRNFGIVNDDLVAGAGLNGKMSELNAAVGLLQLPRVEASLAARGAHDAAYRRDLAGIPGITPHRVSPAELRNYAYFPVLVGPAYGKSRDALWQRLREHGIHARRYFYPLLSQLPMYRDLPSARPVNLPEAHAVAEQVLCLPLFPDLSVAERDRVVSVIAEGARSS